MISVVIPTLGKRQLELRRLFQSLEDQTNKNFEVILVSQDNHEMVSELLRSCSFCYQHSKLDRFGLSYARNVGVSLIKGEIVTFSDDDCWYDSEAFEEVNRFFQQNEAEIVSYQIYDPDSNQYYKVYQDSYQSQIKKRDLYRKSSIELFIHIGRVDKNKVGFNENFGLGAKYPSGEENIFLFSMYRAGYRISYVPKVVVYHLKPTIQSRLNYQTFLSKGPLFKEIYNTPIGVLLLTAMFLKKIHYLEKPVIYYKDALLELVAYQRRKKRILNNP